MTYAIMRFKKTGTVGISQAQKHNEREKTKYKSNPDIDTARIKDDYHIIKPDKPYRAIIKDKLSSANCRIRKDSILMVETILTASPEFMNDLPSEEQKKFFRLATQFFEKEIMDLVDIIYVVKKQTNLNMTQTRLHQIQNLKKNCSFFFL